jgi:tetratricopeptide (TPR) repeat protein
MPLQFRKRIKILPGVYINLSKSGVGLSLGPKGLKYNIGPRGQYMTASLPGTGVYYREKIGGSPRSLTGDKAASANDPVKSLPALGVTTPKPVRTFHEGCQAYFSEEYETAFGLFEELSQNDAYKPDALLMAGLSAYFLEKPEQAIKHLLACMEESGGDQPVPGQPESLVSQYISQETLFTVPVTRFVSAELPYSLMLAPFLTIELMQIHGEIDNAIEIAQNFQGSLSGDAQRLMQLSLAELYYNAERYDDLEQFIIDQVGELENVDNIAVEMMFYWAAMLTKQERYEAAKDVYMRALRKTKNRDPDLLKALQYARADMFAQWGKKAEARKYFEKLYAADPSFADVSERLKALK